MVQIVECVQAHYHSERPASGIRSTSPWRYDDITAASNEEEGPCEQNKL